MSQHASQRTVLKSFLGAVALLLLFSGSEAYAQETIVAFRHGEKPAAGLGQLTCKGFNRALKLPKVLIPRFGKPNALYAPDPAVGVNDHSPNLYSYIRPLATIEPMAIELGMPVNAQIGFLDIARLQSELTKPANVNSIIYVAWEHLLLNEFARQMLRAYGKNPLEVPDWPDEDYDRIYIFKIGQNQGKPILAFKIDWEHLNGSLSDTCPSQ